MAEVVIIMRAKYGFSPCVRSYWKKIKQWKAQKHAAARQAPLTPRDSVDSGYRSQSLCSFSPTISQLSQSTDGTFSERESLATSDQQIRQYGFACENEQSKAFHSMADSRPDGPWSPIASRREDLPTGTAFGQTISPRSTEGPNIPEAGLLGTRQPVHQYDHLAAGPPLSLLGSCRSRNRLSSSTLDFRAPHALSSNCWAAHMEVEPINLNSDQFSCQHCEITKLHHLASIVQKIELSHFKQLLFGYLPILRECDIYGNTCVHSAAGSGASLAQLDALASAGALMMLPNNAGQTFLHVLNIKLYNQNTLAPILQWALCTKGAMAQQDSRNRSVWHSIFQRGISLEIFHSILPSLYRSKDDLMILDNDNHTPLDCLRLYWTSTKETVALDYLNHLQSSRKLPQYFAIHQTAPLDTIVYSRAPEALPTRPKISADVSGLTVGASTTRHDPNDPTRHAARGLLSTYSNGGMLDCNNSCPSIHIIIDRHGRKGLVLC